MSTRETLKQRRVSGCREREKEKDDWRTVAETRKEGERRDIEVGQTKARRECTAPDVHIRKRRWGEEEEEEKEEKEEEEEEEKEEKEEEEDEEVVG